MANSLDPYNLNIYAMSAFKALMKSLGMANAVTRDFTKTANEPGKTIKIKVPSTFTAQTTPGATPQDISTSEIDLTLDTYRKVEFGVTDVELSHASTRLIDDHIIPAAYALADNIDTQLNALAAQVPWYYTGTETPSNLKDIGDTRRILRDNSVAMDGNVYLELNPEREAAFLNYLGAANIDAKRGNVQVSGNLGQLFGMNIFVNQNVYQHTAGSLTGSPLVNGTPAAGATTMNIDAGSLTGTVKAGDTFVIAGNSQRYAVTADATAASNAIAGLAFTPGLAAAPDDDSAITFVQTSADLNLGFHKSAFALGFSPLPLHSGTGAMIRVIQDPVTGVALRLGVYYDGTNKKSFMYVDALCGLVALDVNRAVRYETTSTW